MTAPLEQAHVFLAMLLTGMGLGFLYDGLRLVRHAIPPGRILEGMLDLFFGVCCAAGIILAALCLRVNPMRWYTLAGTWLGMDVYWIGAGNMLRSIGRWCGRMREKYGPSGAKKEK